MANFDQSASMASDMIFKFIKERMKEKNITQLQLSETIGINESTLIRNFQKRTEMTLTTYLKICGALELRPYLIPAETDTSDFEFMHFN
jgi:transcriptional regulator with XRE-family HTH domain